MQCLQIGVHFVEVDFGWDVSETVAKNRNDVLSQLLEMDKMYELTTSLESQLERATGSSARHYSRDKGVFLDPLVL
jgi:hypothetical protein